MALGVATAAAGRVKPDRLTFTLPTKPASVLAGMVIVESVELEAATVIEAVLATTGGTIGNTVTVKEAELVLTPLSTCNVMVAVPVPLPVGTAVTPSRPLFASRGVMKTLEGETMVESEERATTFRALVGWNAGSRLPREASITFVVI